MPEWIVFMHPPGEREVWTVHADRLQGLLDSGVLILAGPTLGRINTGIQVFEAEDEVSARRIMEEDPASPGDTPEGSSGRSVSPFSAGLPDRAPHGRGRPPR